MSRPRIRARFLARVHGPQADSGGTLIPPEVMEKALQEYQARGGHVYVNKPPREGKPDLKQVAGVITRVSRKGDEVRCQVDLTHTPMGDYVRQYAIAEPPIRFKVVPTIDASIAGMTVVHVDTEPEDP